MESRFSYLVLGIWYLTCGLLYNSFSYAQQIDRLKLGSSLSPERNKTVLLSPDGNFSAGFYSVGTNAYSFAIWYYHMPETLVWMANRDQPVNGRNSRLSLGKDGDLVLSDAVGIITWSTNTRGQQVQEAVLLNTGNLVLRSSSGNILWQSFDSPTDTLLPEQLLANDTQLVSRLDPGSYKSGYYHFYFNEDNILSLIYKGSNLSSKYWPRPWVSNPIQNGRTAANFRRVATLDRSGLFSSSDRFSFNASDYGEGSMRRLTMDIDGNLKLYSLDMQQRKWNVTWIAVLDQCRVHGLCGVDGLCVYTPGPKCVCPPGFEMVDSTDWFQGCRLINTIRNLCGPNTTKLLKLPYTDYYGFDTSGYGVMSFEECKKICMDDCDCFGFGYKLSGSGECFPKSLLINGFQWPGGSNDMYVKISANDSSTKNMSSVLKQLGMDSLDCAIEPLSVETNTSSSLNAKKGKRRELVISLACFVSVMGVTEIVCIALGWWFLFRNFDANGLYNRRGYFANTAGLKKFAFSELKRATNNFRDCVGKGGFGTVYKGTLLPENKLVAVKRLEGISRGEDEFWAEVNMIGKVHHMNLVRMFGFCAEGKHKLLVLEFLEKGSLDRYLFGQDSKRVLNWNERLQIAVGTAKGLAYLHEECLEWILHCDVKPQNILLDEQFWPKISDFGLSKLVDSHRDRALSFSTIRGTKGCLAPEWTMNLPITAKADVYSFGILLLELVSGRDAANFNLGEFGGNFVQWADDNMKCGRWMESLVDSNLTIKEKMESGVEGVLDTALHCVEQEMERRPSMSQVVEMLLLCSINREEEQEGDPST